MDKNKVSLKLNGEVRLNDFAVVVDHLAGLMNALSEEIAGPSVVDWQIAELEAGSAMIALAGVSERPKMIEQVAAGYFEVARALQTNTPIPYSKAVAYAAYRIASVINGRVTSISFEGGGQAASINESVIEEDLTDEKMYEFGTITGTAMTLLLQPFGISIEDSVFERRVQCYIPKSYAEQMREAWGKQVSVTGLIYRNPADGRPETVKSIVELTIAEAEKDPLEVFESLRGILSRDKDQTPPETLIRRLRDNAL